MYWTTDRGGVARQGERGKPPYGPEVKTRRNRVSWYLDPLNKPTQTNPKLYICYNPFQQVTIEGKVLSSFPWIYCRRVDMCIRRNVPFVQGSLMFLPSQFQDICHRQKEGTCTSVNGRVRAMNGANDVLLSSEVYHTGGKLAGERGWVPLPTYIFTNGASEKKLSCCIVSGFLPVFWISIVKG